MLATLIAFVVAHYAALTAAVLFIARELIKSYGPVVANYGWKNILKSYFGIGIKVPAGVVPAVPVTAPTAAAAIEQARVESILSRPLTSVEKANWGKPAPQS